MSRLAVLGILLIIVAALGSRSLGQPLSSTTGQSTDHSFLITPGVGIGKVKIGMPIAIVISILGTPKVTLRSPEDGDFDQYAWYELSNRCLGANSDGGLAVVTNRAGTVTAVTAHNDARYFLKNGLRVGSDASLVQARMGRARMAAGLVTCEQHTSYTGSMGYPALGITFFYGPNGPSISVYTPGTR